MVKNARNGSKLFRREAAIRIAPITISIARNSPTHLFDHSSVTRISLLHVANHHESDSTNILTTCICATPLAAMSNSLAEYLSAIEARDAKEKAHEEYINACMCYRYNAHAENAM
jgi:hypothetical protein